MRSGWHTPAMELVDYQAVERVALTAHRGTVQLRWYPKLTDMQAHVWVTGVAPDDATRYVGELMDFGIDRDEADRRFNAVLGTERADMGLTFALNTDDFFEAIAFLAGDPNDWHQYGDGRYISWADMRENYFISEACGYER